MTKNFAFVWNRSVAVDFALRAPGPEPRAPSPEPLVTRHEANRLRHPGAHAFAVFDGGAEVGAPHGSHGRLVEADFARIAFEQADVDDASRFGDENTDNDVGFQLLSHRKRG